MLKYLRSFKKEKTYSLQNLSFLFTIASEINEVSFRTNKY